MSFSLKIEDGDLVQYGSRLAIVTNKTKLEQLMSTWLIERWKCDRFHPSYGSILDNFIGSPISTETEFSIISEIKRVLSNFQKEQRRQLRENPQKYTLDELLNTVDDIRVRQNYDMFSVTIYYTTVNGSVGTLEQRLGING